MNERLQTILDREKIMVIDGSMSTALEQMGCDLNDSLWTALALYRTPNKVKAVHRNYFEAGAECSISCSYQATIPGFMSKGFSLAEAEALIRRSGTLLADACREFLEGHPDRMQPLALAGIGPYGAYLADGSEYRGNYGISDRALRDFHRSRMELLCDTGIDMFLIETQPSLKEAVIAAELAEDLDTDYWISFSCRDGRHINEGNDIRECAAELSGYPHLNMIGVNCTAPEYIESLICELSETTELPIAVYPNSGEIYDPVTKTWSGDDRCRSFGDLALSWMKAGASAVGGCCRTVEKHIREVVSARAEFLR